MGLAGGGHTLWSPPAFSLPLASHPFQSPASRRSGVATAAPQPQYDSPGLPRPKDTAALRKTILSTVEEWEDSRTPDDDEDSDYRDRPWPVYGTVYPPSEPGKPPLKDEYYDRSARVPLMQARVANGFQPLHPKELKEADDGSGFRVGDVLENARNGRPFTADFLTETKARDYADGIAEEWEVEAEERAHVFAIFESMKGRKHGR